MSETSKQALEVRRLGRSAVRISRVGLGCVTFGREIDQDAAFKLMDFAIEHGINFFDTAEIYGGGNAREFRRQYNGLDDIREVSGEYHSSEKIIGRWLRSRGVRAEVVIETKVQTDFTRAHLSGALEKSLERLQTDAIDVYLFHSYDPATPLEESVGAMSELVASGKVRAAGCSNFDDSQLRDALALSERNGWARMDTLQLHYNVLTREAEAGLLTRCREHDVAAVAYSPLAGGLLTGKYRQGQQTFPAGSRFDVVPAFAEIYMTDRNWNTIDRLRKLSESASIPMHTLALGWALRRPELASVLVGARSISHIENALTALRIDLPEHCMQEIDSWTD